VAAQSGGYARQGRSTGAIRRVRYTIPCRNQLSSATLTRPAVQSILKSGIIHSLVVKGGRPATAIRRCKLGGSGRLPSAPGGTNAKPKVPLLFVFDRVV
jgi:hypothetical protein